jgi:hypothetical protein
MQLMATYYWADIRDLIEADLRSRGLSPIFQKFRIEYNGDLIGDKDPFWCEMEMSVTSPDKLVVPKDGIYR